MRVLVLMAIAGCGSRGKGADSECDLDALDRAKVLEAVIDGEATGCALEGYLADLDVRAEGPGPWHQDLFVGSTPDARTFELGGSTPTIEQAAVAEVYRADADRVVLYYGTGDIELGRRLATEGSAWFATHGLIGYGAIVMAESYGGGPFEPVDDFGIRGMVRGMAIDPDLVALPDGRFRLYYVGLAVPEVVTDMAWEEGARHTVFSAISDDLVHWEQEGAAVEGPVADPTVTCMTETSCLMASTGLDWSHSEDGGQTFTFDPLQQPPGFGPEFVREGENGLRLLYNSKDSGGPVHAMASADGGRTWEFEGELIPAWTVEAPSFSPDQEGGWTMAWHYWKEGYSGDTWNGDSGGG